MPYMYDIVDYTSTFLKLHGLKDIVCDKCKAEGYRKGVCPRCLKAQAKAQEWLETHPFIYDNEEVHDYHSSPSLYKSTPLRLKDENPLLYYGIEMEIEFDDYVDLTPIEDDYRDNDDSNINYIISRFNEITGGISVWEHDCSLDHGVECIFRPMSYRYITHPDTVAKLRQAFQLLHDYGAWRGQPSDNGMHVHISKAFFEHGRKTDMRGNPITVAEMYSNFNWLWQVFQPQIEELGGRSWGEYCRGQVDQATEALHQELWGLEQKGVNLTGATLDKQPTTTLPHDNHHTAINTDGATLEVRVFNSTIDVDEMLARLELVRAFAHCAREGYTEPTFDEAVHYKDNLYLDAYIRKVDRRIYKQRKQRLAMGTVGKTSIELDVY